jgi:hypothetical protein
LQAFVNTSHLCLQKSLKRLKKSLMMRIR